MTVSRARVTLSGEALITLNWHRCEDVLYEIEFRLRPAQLDALAAKAVARHRAGRARPATAARGGVMARVTRIAK